jgi:hypothetical protein
MRWPHFPFQLTVAFGSAMYAAVLLIETVRLLRRKPSGSEDVAR